jgi:hypothetical protein
VDDPTSISIERRHSVFDDVNAGSLTRSHGSGVIRIERSARSIRKGRKIVVKLRCWIARTLWCGAGSLGIGLIAGILALVLNAAGDRAGAAAVRGVMLVAFAVFALAFVTLVVMLAINELLRSRDDSDRRSESRGSD